MIEEHKSSKGVCSLLKKTRTTTNGDSSGQKDFHKHATDKKWNGVDSLSSNYSKRRLQFSETKLSLFNSNPNSLKHENKLQTNPQRKEFQHETHEKQPTVEDILSKSLRLVNNYYKNKIISPHKQLTLENQENIYKFNKVFKERIIHIFKQIKYKPKQLACHLNTVFFCKGDVRLWKIQEIQKEIQKQWKENILLRSIKCEWMLCLQKYIPQFQEQGYLIFSQIIYEDFCYLMSHITYVIFEDFYRFKIQKKQAQKEEIIGRLNKRTMRFVVTQGLEWQNYIYLCIDQMIKGEVKCGKLSEQTRSRITYDIIGEMKIQPIRELLETAYHEKKTLFPETQKALSRFLREHYMPSKIKCITGIRVALEQDIIIYQKTLIDQQKLQQIQMFQKDPMLTCLILAVLSSGIELEAIDLGLREVELILGEDFNQILAGEKCSSYFTDLLATLGQIEFEIKREEKEKGKEMEQF